MIKLAEIIPTLEKEIIVRIKIKRAMGRPEILILTPKTKAPRRRKNTTLKDVRIKL
jgi:hypothetical protein